MNKYCCDSFSELKQGHRTNGFSIIENKHEGKISHRLAFHCVPLDKEMELLKALKSVITKEIGNISIQGEIGFSFCPWCGKKII